MTSGNNGASTPEDDDPFGYLYADGQANGAQPPSGGGYGYPNSVSRVRAVGERQYGQQQTAQYGQPPTMPQQQGAYGQPNAHYAAPENFGGGGPSTGRQPAQNGGGRGRGPNTKGLLIGAVAVVAAVVIGIVVAMANGDDGSDDNKASDQPSTSASASASPSPSESAERRREQDRDPAGGREGAEPRRQRRAGLGRRGRAGGRMGSMSATSTRSATRSPGRSTASRRTARTPFSRTTACRVKTRR